MSERLYPTLAADGSLSTPAVDDCSMLDRQITSKLDKYLQEAAEKHERDDNYYGGRQVSTSTSDSQQEANFLEDNNAGSNEEDNDPIIPESHEKDTGTHHFSPSDHQIQPQDELDTILEEEEEPQMEEQPDPADQDTLVFTSDESKEKPFNTAIDTTSDDSTIVMGKPVTTAFISDQVHIPTKKVGCLQVTSQLQEFLDHFPPKSVKKAFRQIYQILQLLDKYLIDNLKQHQYCMSPDSEYILLISYATKPEIDLSNFLAIWAVLSILLDTKSNDLQYVQNLQQVVDNYYDKCTTEAMTQLEQQGSEILEVMYDSVTKQNFDSVSDDVDNVSDAVDSNTDRVDTDSIKSPYDNDSDITTGSTKHEQNATDTLKDTDTKDKVPHDTDSNTILSNGSQRQMTLIIDS